MLRGAIKKVVDGYDLNLDESLCAMNIIMDGNATQSQIGSFLTALRMKGETIDEITGFAKVMREKSERISLDLDYYIDTCGTGGDFSNTFNISTAVSFVAASGGVNIAKHGNRSSSSQCGSADALEGLGCNIMLSPKEVKKCIEDIGMGFMFAQLFHSSMKYAAVPRKEIGIKTVFNLLGPLTNPASAKGQVLGVYSAELTDIIAGVLLNLGVEKAMVLHGLDGLDEISVTDATKITELKDGTIKSYEIKPEDFGILRCSKEALIGGDKELNAGIIKAVFNGEKGPRRDIILMNSAAALYVGKAANSLKDGFDMANELIDSGKALAKLNEYIEYTNKFGNYVN